MQFWDNFLLFEFQIPTKFLTSVSVQTYEQILIHLFESCLDKPVYTNNCEQSQPMRDQCTAGSRFPEVVGD